jgi:hypothetical protein
MISVIKMTKMKNKIMTFTKIKLITVQTIFGEETEVIINELNEALAA